MNFIFVRKSLSREVQLVFGVLFVFILFTLGAVIYHSLEKNLKERNEAEVENTTRLITQMTQIYVNNSIKIHLRTIAEKNREIISYYDRLIRTGRMEKEEALNRVRGLFLDAQYGKIGTTGYLAVVGSDGTLTVHPRSEGQNALKFAFMQKAVQMKNGYLEYQWKNRDEEAERAKAGYLSFYEPWDYIVWASSYKSEFQNLIEMKDLAEQIRNITIGKSGYPFIMDSSGTLIAHPRMEGENIFDNRDENGRYYIREMIERKNGKTYYPGESAENGTPDARFAYFQYYPEMDWIVVSAIPTSEMNALLRHIRLIIFAAIIAACIAVNLASSFLFSRLLSPIRRMKDVSGAISKGDLTQRIAVTSEDEIGQISTRFNGILDDFVDILKQIQASVAVLLESIHNLSASSQEISATSNQQAAAVKEIVTTMEDSDQLAKSIDTRINEVAKIAHATSDAVTSGFTIIQESLDKMNEIKTSNAERIRGVKSLSDRISSIWEIINIINAIADQTKIIAFNAELEAGSAGKAGKNFKIVATEIRRLADSTVESTAEIKSKITEIQHSSDNLILASEEGTEKIMEGWELSNRLRHVFEDIRSSSEISASSADHIATSISQQVSAFDQILLTLKQISEGIDNFVISTRSTTDASQKLREMADGLNRVMNTYNTEIPEEAEADPPEAGDEAEAEGSA